MYTHPYYFPSFRIQDRRRDYATNPKELLGSFWGAAGELLMSCGGAAEELLRNCGGAAEELLRNC
jgi:hypothetical protein